MKIQLGGILDFKRKLSDISGAGNWQDSYSPYLAGKKVFIFQGNDDPGREHSPAISILKIKVPLPIVSLALTQLKPDSATQSSGMGCGKSPTQLKFV